MPTRREALLSGAVALGVTATTQAADTFPSSSPGSVKPASSARHPVPKGPPMRIICLEEHVFDPQVAAATKAESAAEIPYFADIGTRWKDDPASEPQDRPRLDFIPRTIPIAAGPLSARLPLMDAAGIDTQVLSIANQPQLAPKAAAADLARGANDRLAAAAAQHPGRFAAFFTLPWQDISAAVREAERCVRELKLPGTLINGRPDGDLFLDDPRFDPVLAKLAELDAPIYVHPGAPLEAVRQPYYGGFDRDVSARLSLFGWGWHNEAGVQVVRLILSGALDRHPRLKLISGHWGEMVPFYLNRLDDTLPRQVTGLQRTILDTYRDQVWVGPSGMLQLPHFMFVREVVGIDRLVFSIDYPNLTMTGARHWLEHLPISDAERRAFAHGNAQKLLRLA